MSLYHLKVGTNIYWRQYLSYRGIKQDVNGIDVKRDIHILLISWKGVSLDASHSHIGEVCVH